MRRAHVPVVLTLLAVLLASVPSAQAALNGPRPYEASFGYLPGLSGSNFTMASGRMDVVIADGDGTWGFFGTEGTDVLGLTKVCWTATLRTCDVSAIGGLSIHVLPGGSFGVRFPTGADATIEGRHAIALFADMRATGDLNSLRLERTLLAPTVEGEVVFTAIPAIPDSLLADPVSDQAGALAATEAATVIEVREGDLVLATLRGKADPVTFSGQPTLTPIATEFAVAPFEGAGAVARFTAAERGDAAVGLDLGRINRLMDRLYSANAGRPTQAESIDRAAFGPFADATAALFAGAVLHVPTDGARAGSDLAFARTPRLEVRGTPDGAGLAWSGTATLDVRGGGVAHAQPLYGFGFIALPWWGWLLWVAALTVWIVRLVRKPDKRHPTWDRYKWIGWVSAAVVGILVFLLWDREVHTVLGLSLLSGSASGQVLVLVLVLQLATFALLSFAAIAPLRILLRNSSLLLHQGTFMGLAGAVAGLLGYLIGATLLLSGLDLALKQALAAL